MTLRDWLRNGWLVEHQSSRNEARDLLALADRDLRDCQTPGLSADWRFNIAYNAAIQAAAAALAAAGYRCGRESHHHRLIQSLAFTIRADTALIRQLDAFRKKRNLSGYERAGVISDAEAGEMRSLARDLRQAVERWIRQTHPELV